MRVRRGPLILLGVGIVLALCIAAIARLLFMSYQKVRVQAERDLVTIGRCAACKIHGPELSFERYGMAKAAKYLHLPHWEVRSSCTNIHHNIIQVITISEALSD